MASHDPVPRSGAGLGGQADTGGLPGPLRHFVDRLDELRSAEVIDMDQVGRLLVELAADKEFFSPLIVQLLASFVIVRSWSICTYVPAVA